MPEFITDFTVKQVKDFVVSLDEPSYRAEQLLGWVYRKLAVSWDEMTDLPQPFRQKLAASVTLHTLTPIHEVKAKDGTVKVLFSLPDGKTVETALMQFHIPVVVQASAPVRKTGSNRYTICVSTQVGCPVGCPFCATGQQGFERNLNSRRNYRPGSLLRPPAAGQKQRTGRAEGGQHCLHGHGRTAGEL